MTPNFKLWGANMGL